MRQSFAHFRSALHVAVLGGSLLIAGCASLPPPTVELDAARQALVRAEAADADQYAADVLAKARDGLQRAQAAQARGRNEEARAAALAAGADADLARVRSEAARTRAELQQKRAEVADLQAHLQIDPAPQSGDPLEGPLPVGPAEQRLRALDADPVLGPLAPYERLQARQALAALATVARRDLPMALALADRRVGIAEQAARIEATRREIDRLDRERNELLIEASRRDAERARAEAERMRIQAQLQAEEAERLRAQAAQVEAALDSAQAAQQDKLQAAREKEAALARKEAELVAGAKLPPVKRNARGEEVFTLAGDAFASGQTALTNAAAASVRALGLYLAALPNRRVLVVGHTDSQGNPATNQALSEKRAQQVRAGLIAAGLSRDRVSAQGRGATEPVADNGTPSGRARNRRVEIIVSENSR